MKPNDLLEMLEFGLGNVMAAMPSAHLPSEEPSHLAQLRTALGEAPMAQTAGMPPSQAVWLDLTNQFRSLVLERNARKFLQWRLITQTMFPSRAPYISKELAYLRNRPDWRSRWKAAIREIPVGHPARYILYPASSRNLIHQAYHLALFEERSGIAVDKMDLLFEFGGGYGSMCCLVHRLGFRGSYVIFDLPAFSALQLYYLRTAGLSATAGSGDGGLSEGIACISNPKQLQRLLRDVSELGHSLFLALWSVSEVGLELRRKTAELVSGFKSFMIAYQDLFGEVDNKAAFADWQKSLPGVAWRSFPIQHSPGNTYLIGSAMPHPKPKPNEVVAVSS